MYADSPLLVYLVPVQDIDLLTYGK